MSNARGKKSSGTGGNWRQNLFTCLLSVGVVLVLAEVALRSFPSLISIPVLERFNSELRRSVADRLQLSTKSSRHAIPSAERSDGGPDFYTYESNRTIVIPVDPVDMALGATEAAQIDRNGFCNPAPAAERETVDVLLLGDSMTFCTAIDASQTSSAMLEAISGLSAYNLGIPGVGPFEYVELLRRFGLSRKPRFVVMNIYEGNDPRDVERFNDFRQQGRQARDPDPVGGPFAWSYSLAFIKAAVELLWRQIDRSSGLDFRYSVQGPDGRVAMNIANSDRDEVRYARRFQSGELSPAILEPALDTFRDLAREHGFTPIIMLIPGAFTAYAESVIFNDPELAPIMRSGREVISKWLAGYTARSGIIFVDLAPVFQAAAASGPLTHFPANVHLTPEGQRIVAAQILKAIEASGK